MRLIPLEEFIVIFLVLGSYPFTGWPAARVVSGDGDGSHPVAEVS